MLINFHVKNFKSFKNQLKFTTEVINPHPSSEFFGLNTFYNDITGTNHVKSSLILGKNAGGKSNFIKSIQAFIAIIINSFERNTIIGMAQPHRLCESSIKSPVEFEATFVINSKIYRYSFTVQGNKIKEETLSIIKGKTENIIFTRSSSKYEKISISKSFKDSLTPLKVHTKRSVLFLSVLNQFNIDFAMNIVNYFSENFIVITPNQQVHGKKFRSTQEILSKGNINEKNRIKDFIRESDFGIQDIHVTEEKMPDDESLTKFLDALKEFIPNVDEVGTNTIYNTTYSHNVIDDNGTIISSKSFNENLLSSGTRKFVEIASSIYLTLENGGTLILDEVENNLHHILVKRIFEYFNSIHFNPKNAQLIATTHDLLMLDEDIRNDQIWLVDKDQSNSSHLKNLKTFPNINKRSNTLKMYLLGSFRSIPELSDL